MILHIINGDCALKGWKSGNFPGEVLIWRENYLLGVVPETEDITSFNHIRATELHKFAPQKSVAEIFAELQNMHQMLLNLNSGDKLILWLDCCPFDQALKKHLLKLIRNMPEVPEVYLVQQDVVWNNESFARDGNWQDYLWGEKR